MTFNPSSVASARDGRISGGSYDIILWKYIFMCVCVWYTKWSQELGLSLQVHAEIF